ncbi:MAG: hypothetical protein C5B49_00805 [Bdellovibrio sp.]|nr:MAG: hypothetical protein C5B49_00805 [Bdellovibrio sp.]
MKSIYAFFGFSALVVSLTAVSFAEVTVHELQGTWKGYCRPNSSPASSLCAFDFTNDRGTYRGTFSCDEYSDLRCESLQKAGAQKAEFSYHFLPDNKVKFVYPSGNEFSEVISRLSISHDVLTETGISVKDAKGKESRAAGIPQYYTRAKRDLSK